MGEPTRSDSQSISEDCVAASIHRSDIDDMRIDFESALANMTPVQQKLCRLLLKNPRTPNAVLAKRLNRSLQRIETLRIEIRLIFTYAGFRVYFEHGGRQKHGQ